MKINIHTDKYEFHIAKDMNFGNSYTNKIGCNKIDVFLILTGQVAIPINCNIW